MKKDKDEASINNFLSIWDKLFSDLTKVVDSIRVDDPELKKSFHDTFINSVISSFDKQKSEVSDIISDNKMAKKVIDGMDKIIKKYK